MDRKKSCVGVHRWLPTRQAHRTIRVFRRRVLAFQVWGVFGVVLGASLALLLASVAGSSVVVTAGCVLIAILTYIGFGIGKYVLMESKHLVYYHYALVIVVTIAALLALGNLPVVGYLTPIVLGIGLTQAIGRVGCLMAGCCYGRPAQWGVRYGVEHVAAGFPGSLVHARLTPVQLIEGAWSAGVVGTGSLVLLAGHQSGVALTWYVVGYGIGRFGCEFLRGDPARRSALGVSEAQWTAVLTIGAVNVLALAGALPYRDWYLVVLAGLAAIAAAGSLAHRLRAGPTALWAAAHIAEVAAIVEAGLAGDQAAPCRVTSSGISISASAVDGDAGRTYVYGLSRRGAPLDLRSAQSLARLIARLRHPVASYRLIERPLDVFLLVVSICDHDDTSDNNVLDTCANRKDAQHAQDTVAAAV